MASRRKDYFGFSRLASIILAIIPITSCLFGIVTRFEDGNIVAGVLRIILSFTVIGLVVLWIGDLVKIITEGKIWRII